MGCLRDELVSFHFYVVRNGHLSKVNSLQHKLLKVLKIPAENLDDAKTDAMKLDHLSTTGHIRLTSIRQFIYK